MAHAYTPGLRVTEWATIRKDRRLPIAGDVLVETGARVRAEDVVARAKLPGDVATVNVVNLLGITPSEIEQYMLKRQGDGVERDEVIAETRPWIKWFKSVARSPVEGTVETVSKITGQVLLRTPPRPVELTAYLDGTVAEVVENEGVVVETSGAFVQGIFGVGGEMHGELATVVESPDAVIGPDDLGEELADKIVLAGSLVTSEVYERASAIGIAALVCGGFHDRDLRRLLGYDLGVAITGTEDLGTTLMVTEGFGKIRMAARTFELLKSLEGKKASINGATQIRAGVIRPEVVIPLAEDTAQKDIQEKGASEGMVIGSQIRVIRHPYFGMLGEVTDLPAPLQKLPTEAKVRICKVKLESGEEVLLPRANVELIER